MVHIPIVFYHQCHLYHRMIGKIKDKIVLFEIQISIFRYCYVCIGKAKGENLCFVCGNKGDNQLNRCEHCGKLFHEDCLKNAKQQRGKWLCVLCAASDTSSFNNGNTTTKCVREIPNQTF
jgi:hypothetical protein